MIQPILRRKAQQSTLRSAGSTKHTKISPAQSMGVIAFQEYECRVWEALEQLKDNSFYDIRKIVKEENLDLFIKLCCKFILTHPEYEFSEDYTKIMKRCY